MLSGLEVLSWSLILSSKKVSNQSLSLPLPIGRRQERALPKTLTMASLSFSASLSPSLPLQSSSLSSTLSFPSPAGNRLGNYSSPIALFGLYRAPRIIRSVGRRRGQVVRMAPEEEKMTRRSPLDFPIEWERPKPGRRPDIFPQFSPMKSPLPPPMPADPPEEDEEEEEEKEEEEEEDPEKEEKPENPE